MVRGVGCLLLVLGFSGCLFDAPMPSGECRTGDFFAVAQHHPGFTTIEYQYMFYTLQPSGRLFYFRAHETDGSGSGRLTTKENALHNTTTVEVRQEMHTVGVNTVGKDLEISVAYKETADVRLFDEFCGVVAQEFFDYKARYENNNVVDCDAFTFKIRLDERDHQSYSYCDEGPQDVRDAFDAMAQDAARRQGVTAL